MVKSAQPVANAMIKLCGESVGMLFRGSSPCAKMPFSRKTTTDVDGRFSFSDITTGLYSFTPKTAEGKWVVVKKLAGMAPARIFLNEGLSLQLIDLDLVKTK